jgi:hypothetical protein
MKELSPNNSVSVDEGWGGRPVVEHLPSVHEALIPSPALKQKVLMTHAPVT